MIHIKHLVLIKRQKTVNKDIRCPLWSLADSNEPAHSDITTMLRI